MNVCVVGLGKIGLPLAVQFARRGLRVVGADISSEVVAKVNGGVEPFPGEDKLDSHLAAVRRAGLLEATTDTTAAVAASEVIVIVVPLLVDESGRADFAAIDAATAAVAEGLQPDSLVCYETTLPVGTTRTRFAPVLASTSVLELGIDLFVCFSPERVFSGRIFADLRAYPKLVGGLDEASTKRAVAFYERALEFDLRPDLEQLNGVWDLGSAEAAELAKLAETTYRDLNIAFANELAIYADRIGVDVNTVISASNSQPFSHIHRPGIAVGGHCIPVYPRFYLSGDPEARLPTVARDINESMPAYAVQKLSDQMGSLADTTVAVLGAAYRGGVKETAFSGVFAVVEALEALGATAVVHDPLFTDAELERLGLSPHHLGAEVDAVIVQADHDQYRTLSPEEVPGAKTVVDGRDIVDINRFVVDGISVLRLGAPGGLAH